MKTNLTVMETVLLGLCISVLAFCFGLYQGAKLVEKAAVREGKGVYDKDAEGLSYFRWK